MEQLHELAPEVCECPSKYLDRCKSVLKRVHDDLRGHLNPLPYLGLLLTISRRVSSLLGLGLNRVALTNLTLMIPIFSAHHRRYPEITEQFLRVVLIESMPNYGQAMKSSDLYRSVKSLLCPALDLMNLHGNAEFGAIVATELAAIGFCLKGRFMEAFKQSNIAITLPVPGKDFGVAFTCIRVRPPLELTASGLRVNVDLQFALQGDGKRASGGILRGALVGQFEPPLPSSTEPAEPKSNLSTTIGETTQGDKGSESSSTPLLAPQVHPTFSSVDRIQPPLPPSSRVRSGSMDFAALKRRTGSRPPEPREARAAGSRRTHSLAQPIPGEIEADLYIPPPRRVPPALGVPPPLPGPPIPSSNEGTIPGHKVLHRGDSTLLSSCALTERIGRTEQLDPNLITLTMACLTECCRDSVPRSSPTIGSSRRADIVSPSGVFEQLRATLRTISPSDPTLAALDTTRVKGAPWLIQLHILCLLQRMTHHHTRSLEKHERLPTLFMLLPKSTENLRSAVARQTLALIHDLYTCLRSQRPLDAGVAHLLPACLRKASDSTNLFLAEAALEAIDPIVANSSEGACFACIKSLIPQVKTGSMRSHLLKVARRLVEKLGRRLATLPDLDRIITFAVKGLRDASSESRLEARRLCSTLMECLGSASPKELNRIQNKLRPEDWEKFHSAAKS